MQFAKRRKARWRKSGEAESGKREVRSGKLRLQNNEPAAYRLPFSAFLSLRKFTVKISYEQFISFGFSG
jgi:hypothetical protein